MVRSSPLSRDSRPAFVDASASLLQGKCPQCSSTVVEVDSTQGQSYCRSCGIVLEENTIVSEITFGETSGGAAVVQGSLVGADASESCLCSFLSPALGASRLSCPRFWLRLADLRRSLLPSARARMSGPYGNRDSQESKEKTVAAGAFRSGE